MTPTGVGSKSGVNLHHPQTATAGDTSGPGTAMYFFNVNPFTDISALFCVYLTLEGLFIYAAIFLYSSMILSSI